MVLKGHYDGHQVVLDEPVPEEIPANTPVCISFEQTDGKNALEKIAALAQPGGLPHDFALQHEHYVKGAPRR